MDHVDFFTLKFIPLRTAKELFSLIEKSKLPTVDLIESLSEVAWSVKQIVGGEKFLGFHEFSKLSAAAGKRTLKISGQAQYITVAAYEWEKQSYPN